MSAYERMFVQSFFSNVPVWMTRKYGKIFLNAFALFLDLCVHTLEQALYARFPGLGTPTALTLIGQSRGMIRGMSDTDATFGAKLITWLDRWRIAGSQLAIARAVQDYVGGNPKVKVVNRAGTMTTLEAGDSGSSITFDTGWDWDSLSNPERAGFWSEIWIIVYAPPWPIASSNYTSWYWGTHEFGLGFQIPRADVDAITQLVAQWKSAHTYVRSVIFTYEATLFDPATPASMPDGTWGQNSYAASPPHRTRSGRPRTCRFYAPSRDPNNYHALYGD